MGESTGKNTLKNRTTINYKAVKAIVDNDILSYQAHSHQSFTISIKQSEQKLLLLDLQQLSHDHGRRENHIFTGAIDCYLLTQFFGDIIYSSESEDFQQDAEKSEGKSLDI